MGELQMPLKSKTNSGCFRYAIIFCASVVESAKLEHSVWLHWKGLLRLLLFRSDSLFTIFGIFKITFWCWKRLLVSVICPEEGMDVLPFFCGSFLHFSGWGAWRNAKQMPWNAELWPSWASWYSLIFISSNRDHEANYPLVNIRKVIENCHL